MDDNWYALHQHAHDRMNEARAAARTRQLLRVLGPSPRGSYVFGLALIRLGSWVLARTAEPSRDLLRSLATLRAALKSS